MLHPQAEPNGRKSTTVVPGSNTHRTQRSYEHHDLGRVMGIGTAFDRGAAASQEGLPVSRSCVWLRFPAFDRLLAGLHCDGSQRSGVGGRLCIVMNFSCCADGGWQGLQRVSAYTRAASGSVCIERCLWTTILTALTGLLDLPAGSGACIHHRSSCRLCTALFAATSHGPMLARLKHPLTFGSSGRGISNFALDNGFWSLARDSIVVSTNGTHSPIVSSTEHKSITNTTDSTCPSISIARVFPPDQAAR